MASAMSNYDDIDDLLEAAPKPKARVPVDYDDIDLDGPAKPEPWAREKIDGLFANWSLKFEERYRWAVFWILNARSHSRMSPLGSWTPALPLWEAQMLEHLHDEVQFWLNLEEQGVELLTAFDMLVERKNLPMKQDPTNYLPSGRLLKEADNGRKSEQSDPHRKPRKRPGVEDAPKRPSGRELFGGDH